MVRGWIVWRRSETLKFDSCDVRFLDGKECKKTVAVLSRSYNTSVDGTVLVLRIEKLLYLSKIDI